MFDSCVDSNKRKNVSSGPGHKNLTLDPGFNTDNTDTFTTLVLTNYR
jgi:hypothetical protein